MLGGYYAIFWIPMAVIFTCVVIGNLSSGTPRALQRTKAPDVKPDEFQDPKGPVNTEAVDELSKLRTSLRGLHHRKAVNIETDGATDVDCDSPLCIPFPRSANKK